jgi:acyl carrier protein
MGLELWEFVLGLKKVFDIDISESEVLGISSPSDVIDCVWAKIPQGTDNGCISQKAFYRIRRIISESLGKERPSVKPSTLFADIFLSSVEYDSFRNLLTEEFADFEFPNFAQEKGNGVFGHLAELVQQFVFGGPSGIRQVSELVQYVVADKPLKLKPKTEGWSRRDVGEVVKIRAIRELCVRYACEKDLFAEDLGVTE